MAKFMLLLQVQNKMLIQSEPEVYRMRVPTEWYFKAELQIWMRIVTKWEVIYPLIKVSGQSEMRPIYYICSNCENIYQNNWKILKAYDRWKQQNSQWSKWGKHMVNLNSIKLSLLSSESRKGWEVLSIPLQTHFYASSLGKEDAICMTDNQSECHAHRQQPWSSNTENMWQ